MMPFMWEGAPQSAPPERGRPQAEPEPGLTARDRAVIEAVLLDFLAYRGKDLHLVNQGGAQILLVDTTARGGGLLSDNQIDGDLEPAQARDVTPQIRERLRRRN